MCWELEDIADLPDRKRQVNHNTEYKVLEDGNKRLISLKNVTGTAKVTIELADIEKVTEAISQRKSFLYSYKGK